MEPLISIVTAYFNRLHQFLFTLKTIERSSVKNRVEVVVVDDGSLPAHVLTKDHLAPFSFPIRVFRINPKAKTWINPVIPFNLAISKARGQWIILQNPEVCHVGDVCAYVANKATKPVYHVLPVWALAKEVKPKDYQEVVMGHHGNPYRLSRVRLGKRWKGQWYCRPAQPRRAYHFCSAIHRSLLDRVGGFNPNMARGVWYDDDEFLARVRRVAKVVFVPPIHAIMGLHQWHPSFSAGGKVVSNAKKSHGRLRAINARIFMNTRRNTKKIHCDRMKGLPLTTSYTLTEHNPSTEEFHASRKNV